MPEDLTTEKKTLEAITADWIAYDPLHGFVYEAALRVFAPWLKAGRILELGAGAGNFTKKLADLGEGLDTVEGSSLLCARLRDKSFTDHRVFDSLFEEFEPERRYISVFATFVNEHVADTRVIYDIARKALLPDGHLFIIVPNRRALSRQLACAMDLLPDLDSLSPADLKIGHRRTYDNEAFRDEI
ncbi:MAG: methyltransferase domain-containing protein, partial [Alphaproteobacteria bacterium]|nr:methyltransferase domain-containing protein [Alphaproteobacteria bacterium]